MAERFPKDRFDDIPPGLSRIGAHRAPPRKGRGWIVFMWAAIATVVLVAAGITGLLILDDQLGEGLGGGEADQTPVPSVVQTAEPTIDPNASITVLNGTDTPELATKAIAQLNAAGWSQTITPSNADRTVETTTVYYQDPSQEGAARGVAEALGGASIQLSDQLAVPTEDGADPVLQILVVLGADYVPPAGE